MQQEPQPPEPGAPGPQRPPAPPPAPQLLQPVWTMPLSGTPGPGAGVFSTARVILLDEPASGVAPVCPSARVADQAARRIAPAAQHGPRRQRVGVGLPLMPCAPT